MIMHESLYLEFIIRRGVGTNDRVASSPDSYISYLRSVGELIRSDITPEVLRSEADVSNIAKRLKGKRAEKTIRNYCSAMRQYVAMVEADGL
jgi:hypothetical protein